MRWKSTRGRSTPTVPAPTVPSTETAPGPRTTVGPAATPPDADTLALRPDYVSRRAIEVFDDVAGVEDGVTHQPDVYQLVAYLVERTDARRIVDIGCGSAKKLLALTTTADLIGIDHPSTVRTLRELHPTGSWIAADLEAPSTEPRLTTAELAEDAVVVCSDVIEHLLDPRPLLALLRSWRHRAKAIVISTPDRVRVRGVDDIGPPANPFHVREWQLDEFGVLLRSAGLAPTFLGYTVNNDRDLQKRTILAIVDPTLGHVDDPPTGFQVEALYSCYNEVDIVGQSVAHLLREGLSVTVIDDWSTDGTWELLHERFGSDGRVRFLRHGAAPGPTYEWASILALKQQLALESTADWVVHHDADELRFSPWAGVSTRTALWNAQRRGFNAVDHSVLDLRPLADGYSPADDPQVFFRHFQWGRRPGHFLQVKAWRNTGQPIDLVTSGGHSAEFPGRRVSPYKHLLCHYPLRSLAQSNRKVTVDRRDRFSSAERSRGWHVQYDTIDVASPWSWTIDDVEHWDPETFAREWLTERISGVGIVR